MRAIVQGRALLGDISEEIEIDPVVDQTEEAKNRSRSVREIGGYRCLIRESSCEVLMIDAVQGEMGFSVEPSPPFPKAVCGGEYHIRPAAKLLLLLT